MVTDIAPPPRAHPGSRRRLKDFVRRRLHWDDDSRVARLLEVLTPEDAQRQPSSMMASPSSISPMTDGLQGCYWDFPQLPEGPAAFMNRGVFDSRAAGAPQNRPEKKTLRQTMAERDRNLTITTR